MYMCVCVCVSVCVSVCVANGAFLSSLFLSNKYLKTRHFSFTFGRLSILIGTLMNDYFVDTISFAGCFFFHA